MPLSLPLRCVWHDSCMCVTWLVYVRDMTHACVWDFTYARVRHDSCMCVPWFNHLYDMPRSSTWQDSFMCVAWLIHVCAMTHWSMWHVLFMCVPWLIHVCAMTHSSTWHVSYIANAVENLKSQIASKCSIYPYLCWRLVIHTQHQTPNTKHLNSVWAVVGLGALVAVAVMGQ